MNYRASNVTRVTLNADRTIGNTGDTMVIFAILLANNQSCPAEVDIQNQEGTKTITVVVPPAASFLVDIEWVADNGIKLSSINNIGVIATIFHSSAGA